MGKCRDCIHHDVCKDFIDTALENLIPATKRKEYRIISNEPEKERENHAE